VYTSIKYLKETCSPIPDMKNEDVVYNHYAYCANSGNREVKFSMQFLILKAKVLLTFPRVMLESAGSI
jgi:hypothetical protein